MKLGTSMPRAALWIALAGVVFIQPVVKAQLGPGPAATQPVPEVTRGPKNFTDLCKITLVDGRLVARPTLPPDDQNLAEVNYVNMIFRRFTPSVQEWQKPVVNNPDGSTILDSLRLVDGRGEFQMNLQRQIQQPNGSSIVVAFSQLPLMTTGRRGGGPGAPPPNPLGPPSFRMITTIKEVQPDGKGKLISIRSTNHITPGHDFATFIKQHPDETSQYLLPILRSFQIEYLVNPSDWQLVQVLPEAFKPDDATIKEVKALLEKLDSDSPDDRQAASKRLADIGPVAAAILAKIDPQSLSPEQAARITSLCQQRLTDPQVTELATSSDFLTDCLNDSRRTVRDAALTALKKLMGQDILFDLDIDDSGKRSLAVKALRDQLKPTTRP